MFGRVGKGREWGFEIKYLEIVLCTVWCLESQAADFPPLPHPGVYFAPPLAASLWGGMGSQGMEMPGSTSCPPTSPCPPPQPLPQLQEPCVPLPPASALRRGALNAPEFGRSKAAERQNGAEAGSMWPPLSAAVCSGGGGGASQPWGACRAPSLPPPSLGGGAARGCWGAAGALVLVQGFAPPPLCPSRGHSPQGRGSVRGQRPH